MGEGGFGSVFEGTRYKDGLSVAVKLAAKTENMPYISLVSRLCSLCHLYLVTVCIYNVLKHEYFNRLNAYLRNHFHLTIIKTVLLLA